MVKTVERDDTIHIEKRRPTYSKRGGETTSNASAIKSVKPKKLEELLDFERAIYGDRCPVGFEKLQLLGKGGCAIVWLAKEMATGLNVALK